MRKGMISYVTEGKDDVPQQDFHDLVKASVPPTISAVHVATSEDELMYGWWHLIARGMHHVSCAAAVYDPRAGFIRLAGRCGCVDERRRRWS